MTSRTCFQRYLHVRVGQISKGRNGIRLSSFTGTNAYPLMIRNNGMSSSWIVPRQYRSPVITLASSGLFPVHFGKEYRHRKTLIDIFLPVFGTVDTGQRWNSQVCPRAIGGNTTCHKMRHSLSLPTVTHICMRELPHFHHGPTSSFLHAQPIQTHPSGSGLIFAAGQEFNWNDPSVTPLS